MTLEQFETWLALYGADLSRWPQSERQQAEHALVENSAFADIVAEYAAFEGRLNSWQVPLPEDMLGAITRRAAVLPQQRALRGWRAWAVAATLALFVVGYGVGVEAEVDFATVPEDEIIYDNEDVLSWDV